MERDLRAFRASEDCNKNVRRVWFHKAFIRLAIFVSMLYATKKLSRARKQAGGIEANMPLAYGRGSVRLFVFLW